MGTNSASDTDSPDTDGRIDAKSSAADRSNGTMTTVLPLLADGTDDHPKQSRFFDSESESVGDELDGFVADVTTIVQARREHATEYADIETLVCRLPIDHLAFAANDSLAPYSGPYPMALLVRAFMIEEINNWDETALHDHLRANPSLRQDLGFETLPDQSTLWREWNERFSAELRDAVRNCADSIVTVARACEIPLLDRIESDEVYESGSDDRPKH